MKFLFITPGDPLEYGNWRYPAWRGKRVAPIDTLSVMSYLHAHGHRVKLLDCVAYFRRFRTIELERMVCAVADHFRPDVIGVRMYTGEMPEGGRIVAALKARFPEIPAVAGGIHPSVEPEDTFDRIPQLDAVCVGPGEEVCLDIAEGKTWREIPGLMLRSARESYRPREPETDLDKYPFPNYDLVDAHYYTEAGIDGIPGFLSKSLPTVMTRSCPHSCKFCAHRWSRPFRRHSPEYVLEMVKRLSRYDIQWIFFEDASVVAGRSWTEEVCEGFIRSGLFHPRGRLRWRAFARADDLDPKLLKLMKQAGCGNLALGMESGSDRILERIDKGITAEQVKQAVRWINQAGIVPSGIFIIGFPTETEDEILQTFKAIQEMEANRLVLTCFQPLPGSPFYYELLEKGVLVKKEMDWSVSGRYRRPPRKSYCEVGPDRLMELFDKGYGLCDDEQYYTIFEDHARRIPSSTMDELDRSFPRKGLRVLVENLPYGDPALTAVPYGKWRTDERRLGRTAPRRDHEDEKPASYFPDHEEWDHVVRFFREASADPVSEARFNHLLYDRSGVDLLRSLQRNLYGKRFWRRSLFSSDKGVFFRPTTHRDHLATPYLETVSREEAGERLRVICAFSRDLGEDGILLISVQDERYEILSEIACNPELVRDGNRRLEKVFRMPEHIRRVRLVLSVFCGTSARIPDLIRVEQYAL